MVKILIVDDEPDLSKHLEWAARNEGREIVIAEGVLQAIRLIQENDFSTIITDLRMPGDNEGGISILKAAKEKDVYTQVIVVSAYATPKITVEAMRLGAFDFLERNAPGVDTLGMIRSKITLAIEFGIAKQLFDLNPVQLVEILDTRFSVEELSGLCFALHTIYPNHTNSPRLEYDSLPGEGKGAKARELVLYCQRRELLDKLVSVIRQQRPDVQV